MTIRVLIVEDEVDIAKLLSRFLEQSGLEVDHVADGDEGVEQFKRSHYDVVLIDGLLPKRNGFAVAEAIRKAPGGLKVGLVMMSAAFRSASSRKEALNRGFDAFFAKPFIVAELFEEVLRLAETRAGQARPTPEEVKEARLRIAVAAREAQEAEGGAPAGAPEAPAPTGVRPPMASAGARIKAAPSASSASSVASSSSARARPPAPAAARAARAGAPAPKPAEAGAPSSIRGPETAPFALLQAARDGRTCLMRFADGSGVLEIALLRGVPVGAWDNLRENRFGERLVRSGLLTEENLQQIDARMRQHEERFAEAAIALGVIDENQALSAIDAQTRERLTRAISWSSGEITFHDDEGAVERLYSTPLDLVECILRAFLEHPDPALIDKLRADLKGAPLEATRDYESGLIPFSRLRPTSVLPGQFFAGPRALDEILSMLPDAGTEVVALRMAGLLRAPSDPVADRSVPVDLRSPAMGETVDADAIRAVRGALLKARGRDLYALLGVPRDADEVAIQIAFAALDARFGPNAIALEKLGGARDDARDLWARFDDARATLLDAERRAVYDQTLPPPGAPLSEAASPAERAFLMGRVALSRKAFAEAEDAFKEAVRERPNDVDYLSFQGWATIVAGRLPRAQGVAILERARALNPQAMRPLFFLGLSAAQEGDRARAQVLLTQAARRAPDDKDVLTALDAISKSS